MTSGGGPATPDGGAGGAERAAGRRVSEDQDLSESLTGLAALATVRLPLEQLLTRVARFAVQAIPGADGAGLTLLEQDRAETLVATADFVSAVDAVQYGLGDGPCIMAAREGRTVMSGGLRDDPRWGEFGGRVADMGVHSVVSLPLQHAGEVLGAMNVYAHAENAFDERAAELGEAFAVPAAIAVQNAHVLEQTRRLADRLQAALQTRAVVEQAVGVLISRDQVSAAEAQRLLRARATGEGRSVAEVAHDLLDEVVRRRDAGPGDR